MSNRDRLLLEGGEVVETLDAGSIDELGNLFKSVNVNEINTVEDAEYFARIILETWRSTVSRSASWAPAIPALRQRTRWKLWAGRGAGAGGG